MFARYESAIAVASCHQLMNEMRRKGIYIVKIIHHLYWPNDLAIASTPNCVQGTACKHTQKSMDSELLQ